MVYGGDDRWHGNWFLPQKTDPEPYAVYGTADYDGAPVSEREFLERVKSLGVGDVENYERTPQPVYINGNVYTAGAKNFDREEAFVRLENKIPFSLEEEENGVYLTIDVDPGALTVPPKPIAAEDLGQVRIVQQPFTQGTGHCLMDPLPGAWKPGYNRILLWARPETLTAGGTGRK